MAIYKVHESDFSKLSETTFSREGIKERQDLQRILKHSIDVIAPDTLVIAEEFGEWTVGQRRIDLLAIDRNANLVVIELKRTQDGGHMELQALRYASMISAMTFRRAVEVYSDYLGEENLGGAEENILNFLDWDTPNQEDFATDVRVVLASSEFSRELTTSVLWLNEKGLDIRCIRMKPYRSDDGILINIEQIIPLPEAEEYQISVRDKRQQQKHERVTSRDTARRDLTINGKSFTRLPKRKIIFEVVLASIASGADIEDIRAEMPKNKWFEVDGEVQSSEFVKAAYEFKALSGRVFNTDRYFIRDEELFRMKNKTYALSNQWGKSTQEHVSKLAGRYGLDVKIDW